MDDGVTDPERRRVVRERGQVDGRSRKVRVPAVADKGMCARRVPFEGSQRETWFGVAVEGSSATQQGEGSA